MKQRLSFVTIAVKDFEAAYAFYCDTLGWKPFNSIEGTIAFFNVGGLVFSICAYQELTDDIGHSLHTEPYVGVTLSQNLPTEQAVDEAFAALRKAGVPIVKEPVRASWGGYSGYFANPEGHLWELAYNPQFEFDGDQMIIPGS